MKYVTLFILVGLCLLNTARSEQIRRRVYPAASGAMLYPRTCEQLSFSVEAEKSPANEILDHYPNVEKGAIAYAEILIKRGILNRSSGLIPFSNAVYHQRASGNFAYPLRLALKQLGRKLDDDRGFEGNGRVHEKYAQDVIAFHDSRDFRWWWNIPR